MLYHDALKSGKCIRILQCSPVLQILMFQNFTLTENIEHGHEIYDMGHIIAFKKIWDKYT
jgi:hypothetical protein